MRIHLIGLPHTKTSASAEFLPCAYTQKVWKLARMLVKLGYNVTHYGTEGADVPCEHVDVLSDEAWRKEYGNRKPNEYYNIEVTNATRVFNVNTIAALQKRAAKDDIILFSFGQREIGAGLYEWPFQVESGIGYEGVFAPYRIYESYAWMHYINGKLGTGLGRWYDVVIPNYFDPTSFYVEKPADKGDYFLYIGRMIYNKGVRIAIDTCKRLDAKLLLIGQGNPADLGPIDAESKVVFLGPVLDPSKRAQLLAKAQAVFVPTIYVEPFGGVAVEAMMSGTPVLTSNFGAFTETIIHGVTGWRCQNLDDFVWGASHLDDFSPQVIRDYAVANYSMDRCGLMYQEYFTRLQALNDPQGWNKPFPEKSNLDWLRKEYP